jgi:hypothetical protein
VLAFIPLTQSVFWGPLAYTLIGGTAAGTALILLFLPALYSIWYRVKPTDARGAQPPEASDHDRAEVVALGSTQLSLSDVERVVTRRRPGRGQGAGEVRCGLLLTDHDAFLLPDEPFALGDCRYMGYSTVVGFPCRSFSSCSAQQISSNRMERSEFLQQVHVQAFKFGYGRAHAHDLGNRDDSVQPNDGVVAPKH